MICHQQTTTPSFVDPATAELDSICLTYHLSAGTLSCITTKVVASSRSGDVHTICALRVITLCSIISNLYLYMCAKCWNTQILEHLQQQPSANWQLVPAGSLVTSTRECGTLARLQQIPILDYILHPAKP